MAENVPDEVFVASARFAQERCSNNSIRAFYNGEDDLGALFEDFALLASMVETDFTLGLPGELEVLLPDAA